MFRLSALALLAASVTVAAPVPKGDKKDNLYFPTVEGAKRVVEIQVRGRPVEAGDVTEVVKKVESKDGSFTVTVERSQPGGGPVNTTSYTVSADGVMSHSKFAEEAVSVQILKLGVKAGDTWTTKPKGAVGGLTFATTHTMGGEEEVEVPAGKFKAIRVDSETVLGERTEKVTSWYAAGVGRVKSEYLENGKTTHTTVLKSFAPGTEAKADDKKKDEPKKDK